MPRSVPWTRAMKLALIHEYRRHPILWQQGHRDSKYTPAKTKIWCEIANNLRMPVRECQQKMLSCKAVYRKIRALVRKRQEGEVIPRESWFAYKHLRFLDVTSRRSVQHDSMSDEELQYESSQGKYEQPDALPCDSVKLEELDEEDLISVEEPSVSGTAIPEEEEEDNTCEQNDRVRETVLMVSPNADHTLPDEVEPPGCPLDAKKVNNERPDYPSHPFDAFGRYVAAELLNMPVKAAILLQQQLHQCIINAKLVAIGP